MKNKIRLKLFPLVSTLESKLLKLILKYIQSIKEKKKKERENLN